MLLTIGRQINREAGRRADRSIQKQQINRLRRGPASSCFSTKDSLITRLKTALLVGSINVPRTSTEASLVLGDPIGKAVGDVIGDVVDINLRPKSSGRVDEWSSGRVVEWSSVDRRTVDTRIKLTLDNSSPIFYVGC